jgi:translation initiation factor 4E
MSSPEQMHTNEPTQSDSSANVCIGEPELPLQFEWTVLYDSAQNKGVSKEDFESQMREVARFHTVQEFFRFWNNLTDLCPLHEGSHVRLFKNGIRPLWDDPVNANGGKWVSHVVRENKPSSTL